MHDAMQRHTQETVHACLQRRQGLCTLWHACRMAPLYHLKPGCSVSHLHAISFEIPFTTLHHKTSLTRYSNLGTCGMKVAKEAAPAGLRRPDSRKKSAIRVSEVYQIDLDLAVVVIEVEFGPPACIEMRLHPLLNHKILQHYAQVRACKQLAERPDAKQVAQQARIIASLGVLVSRLR